MISVFLIFTFSIVMGHSIIPHHHHSDYILASQQDTCPIDNQENNGSHHKPLHCHAFNALSFYKATATTFFLQLDRLLFSSAENNYITNLQVHSYHRILIPVMVCWKNEYYASAIPRRGPPAIC